MYWNDFKIEVFFSIRIFILLVSCLVFDSLSHKAKKRKLFSDIETSDL